MRGWGGLGQMRRQHPARIRRVDLGDLVTYQQTGSSAAGGGRCVSTKIDPSHAHPRSRMARRPLSAEPRHVVFGLEAPGGPLVR